MSQDQSDGSEGRGARGENSGSNHDPVMDYLKSIEARMAQIEKNSAKNAKRTARRSQLAKRRWQKVKPRLLATDFDDVADQNNGRNKKESPQDDEVILSQERRGGQTRSGSRHTPASSEARSTSVFDKLGKKLSEHDLRVRLEQKKKEAGAELSENTKRRERRRDDTPPNSGKRDQRRRDKGAEQEGESKARGEVVIEEARVRPLPMLAIWTKKKIEWIKWGTSA